MVSLQGKLDLNRTLTKAEEHFYNYCKRSSWDYLNGLYRTRKSKEDHFLYQLRNLFSWDQKASMEFFKKQNLFRKTCDFMLQWDFGNPVGILFQRMMLLLTRVLNRNKMDSFLKVPSVFDLI